MGGCLITPTPCFYIEVTISCNLQRISAFSPMGQPGSCRAVVDSRRLAARQLEGWPIEFFSQDCSSQDFFQFGLDPGLEIEGIGLLHLFFEFLHFS